MSDATLASRWAELRAQGRAALIPYVTAGFPDAAATAEFLRGAEAAGADLIELGIPWSDPVADGPVIQASTHAALRGGMTLARALDVLEAARPAIPVIVFSYLNPILAFGARAFAARARAGAAGILITDLPVGADRTVEADLRSSGLPLVRLVAPTTEGDRLKVVAGQSEGFVYLIARLGVTGRTDKTDETDGLRDRVRELRAVTDLPLAVGFGVSDPGRAAEVASLADGVVVGSAIVERMAKGGAPAALAFLAELRDAMDGARSPA